MPTQDEESLRCYMEWEDFLREKVFAATKEGRHWGRGGAIALGRQRLEVIRMLGGETGGFAPLASTYYAAAHFAASKIRLHPSALLWGARFLGDLAEAWHWIERHREAVGGFEKMSAGALDIYAAIAELRGDLWTRITTVRANSCYRVALEAVIAAGKREGLSDDDRALNLIRHAGLMRRMSNRSEAHNEAMVYVGSAFRMMERVSLLTQVRIRREYGLVWEWIGPLDHAEQYLSEGLALAERHGFTDQVEKIRPILAWVRKKRRGRRSWF